MRRLRVLALVLVFVAACVPDPSARYGVRYGSNVSSLEAGLEAAFEQCEQTAERLDLYNASTLEERPDYGFPNQVTVPDELVEGGIYVWCYVLTGDAVEIMLTSDPYEDENPDGTILLLVDLVISNLDGDYYTTRSLSTMGLVPYRDGRWNSVSVILYP